jgi:hypothetical protein
MSLAIFTPRGHSIASTSSTLLAINKSNVKDYIGPNLFDLTQLEDEIV